MRFTWVGGHLIHYELGGTEGGPPLVFVNSLGTDLRIWDDVVSHLSDFRLIRYDKRGHGLSDSPAGPYAISEFADDLAGLLAALEVGPALVVGISIGGMIALQLAARDRGRVRGLVVADTAPRVGSPEKWQERIDGVLRLGMERMAPAILPVWFRGSFAEVQPELHRGCLHMLARMPAAGYAASCAALRDADLSGVVSEVSVPTLVLNGDQDAATPAEQARGLAAALPSGRFQVIADAGHLICVEQPFKTAAAIRSFAEELGYV